MTRNKFDKIKSFVSGRKNETGVPRMNFTNLLILKKFRKMANPKVRATNYHEDLLANILAEAAIEEKSDKFEIINVKQWLQENQKFFVPPVCNKLMYHT